MKKLGRLFSGVHDFTSEEARQLLHNKFVVVIGDSNYRAIYKDLVYILQTDELLTLSQLKQKDGEFFENDRQVEFNGSHSRNDYRLVHQYRTRHHLVRFYFITRVYSTYTESILNDFRADLEADLVPDVVILNSCLWDLNRYHDDVPTEPPVPKAIREYCENAEKLFQALDNILPSSCLIIWVTALPIRENAHGYVIQVGGSVAFLG
ncbi:PC-esterase domain-containing protein 1B-like [Python bivittatus]|uniref:PC-esterase domain-containing protein 1B-like n=1 Tax=Python bivittatus TaxID=176946 RepID=A0A9F5J9D7_PYTBI|nr:PC-esterase domain-containing protein 1B-like [Python bivittatus]